jgi:hypothetical protein
LARASDWSRVDLEMTARRITGSDLLARVAHDGAVIPRRRANRRLADVSRLVGRVRDPIGTWIHTRHDNTGRSLAERLGALLVVVRSGSVPVRIMPWWYLREVAPVLLRPGAFVSWGPNLSWGAIHPDVVVEGEDSDAARKMVSAMTARVVRCVS